MVSLKQLFEWFTTGKFPTEAQFAEQFKSFWHKSERINQSAVLGLNEALDDKASKEDLEKVTTKFKGYYSTLAELQTAYPQTENIKDFFAWVGSPYPGTVWKVFADGGAWTDTGEIPTQQEVDLAEYLKKEALTNEITDDVDTVPSNHAVNNLQVKLYGGSGNSQITELIPFADGTKNALPDGTWYYFNSDLMKGKYINNIKLKSENGGTMTIYIGKNINTSSFSQTELKQVTLTSGVNIIPIAKQLASDEVLGFFKVGDTAKLTYESGAANSVGGGNYRYDGVWTSFATNNLCIGVFIGVGGLDADGDINKLYALIEDISSGGTITELIPFADGTKNALPDGTWYYFNSDLMKGKYINNLKLKSENGGTMTIYIGKNINTSSFTQTELKQITLTSGVNIIPIAKQLASDEVLGFFKVGDTAKLTYESGAANSVGGGNYRYDDVWTSFATNNLCIGLFIGEGDTSTSDIAYISLGDSITFGAGANTPYPVLINSMVKFVSFTNLAISGATAFNDPDNGFKGLMSQVNTVPNGFSGLITCMIGVNDYDRNRPLGEVESVMTMNYSDLALGRTFAESFRYCLETLLRKTSINASIVFFTPFFTTWDGAYPLQSYRDIEHQICTYFGVRCIDIYNECRISPLTKDALMPDGVHPNDAGQQQLAKTIYPYIEQYT
ncbi:SGNH/GDSL hydrolase family protein [Dysgonomonas reticulitermitis]